MTYMRINPRHWTLKEYNLGDIVITHVPIEVTDEQADVLRPLKRQALPLVIEVDPPAKPAARRKPKPASNKEAASAPKKPPTT